MKIFLMNENTDFEFSPLQPKDISDVEKDLELNILLEHMAQGDPLIYDVCRYCFRNPLLQIEEIEYRQANVLVATQHSNTIRAMYKIALDTEEQRRKSWLWLDSSFLSSAFSSAIGLLKIYLEMLKKLRLVIEKMGIPFSEGPWKTLAVMIQNELNEDFYNEASQLLGELNHWEEILITASLGNELQGINYIMRRKKTKGFWKDWFFAPSYKVDPRDDSGIRDIGKRRDRAINDVANALAQSAEHLGSFMVTLGKELAFYVGCINLAEILTEKGLPHTNPKILPYNEFQRTLTQFYDVSLALITDSFIIRNSIDYSGKKLIVITGANQGGKTTFLRSIGQIQVLAQAGVFVPAETAVIPLRNSLFSHFKTGEDPTMTKGKLDEELSRMSDIVREISPYSLILMNESFSSTNEYEGSEIYKQITSALIDNNIEAFVVTHLYRYAMAYIKDSWAQYYTAQRLPDGTRTFLILEGPPQKTAYGTDLTFHL